MGSLAGLFSGWYWPRGLATPKPVSESAAFPLHRHPARLLGRFNSSCAASSRDAASPKVQLRRTFV
eukprot:5155722-Pleurochrysis_carterae.AAC.1